MNEPTKSKINWTALATQIVTILFLAGLIPEIYETPVIAIIGIVMPAFVQAFRTWYTAPRRLAADEYAEMIRLKRKFGE